MKDIIHEKLLRESLKVPHQEINVHDTVMEKVELYEMKKLKRSYIFEIVLSSLLIIACLLSIGFVYWYFSLYRAVFSIFPGSTVFVRDLFIGMFVVFIFVLLFIIIRIIRNLIEERNKPVNSG